MSSCSVTIIVKCVKPIVIDMFSWYENCYEYIYNGVKLLKRIHIFFVIYMNDYVIVQYQFTFYRLHAILQVGTYIYKHCGMCEVQCQWFYYS